MDKRGRKARQRGGKGIRESRLRVRSGVSERMVWEGRRKKKGMEGKRKKNMMKGRERAKGRKSDVCG